MRFLAAVIIAALSCPGVAWAKSGPTLHTRQEIDRVRALCKTDAWAVKERQKAEAGAARWVAMSDEALWAFILDADIPRALNVNFGVGCPVHGKAVFQKGGHYPWVMTTDQPFKVKCPVGGEVYPSNDFAAYLEAGRTEKLDTTQPYVDDGRGYVAPDGQRYWFVAHYVFWQRWRRDILSAMDALNHAYLLTGDAKYAHKLGVMLSRMVEVYPKMDYAKQAYHNGRWPAGIQGRVLDYIWENGTINRFARCYDGIYDAIDRDKDLSVFLAARGVKNLKQEFEKKVLHFMARDVMAGRIRGNMYYQPTLASLAIAIDNDDASTGPTTQQMVDWLLRGGGEIEFILYNGFDRDGAGGESAPGYSSSWNTNFCKVAELLARLGVDVTKDPRWRQVIRFPYNLTIGSACPRIGDCHGTIHRAPKLVNSVVCTFGYKHFRDPQCAQLLLTLPGVFKKSLWGTELDRADVEKVARSAPDQTRLGTRNLGGYGLGVFECRDGPSHRAAYLYYGSADAWHGHHDRLTIGCFAQGRDLLPEMGYPSHWNAKGGRFTRGMPCHYIVEVDQRRSANKKSGYLDYFAVGSRARVMRAHAEAIYPGLARVYRRTFAMIDTVASAGTASQPKTQPTEGSRGSFLIDLFHVQGGKLHDYHFHGLPFGTFTTQGLRHVSTQETGTLLGEKVAWGKDTSKNASGYDFLRNVRRHKADGVWSARWVGRDDCRLTYWMPSFSDVIVCDGEPPAKPNYPETMEFVVVRNAAAETRFPAVIVPSRKTDPVTNVAFEQQAGETHYRVETVEGAWRIRVSDDGAFGAVLNRPDGSAYAFSANQDAVELAGKRARIKHRPVFAIKAVDYASNTVTVTEPIDAPDRLVGQVCVIAPPGPRGPKGTPASGHSASYTVASADRHQFRFEGPAQTGIILVETARGAEVTTKSRLSGYGTQISARSFVGMALVSEDLARSARIATYGSPKGVATFGLAKHVTFTDSDGDGRRLAYFADFAPGYTVTFAPWIEIERARDGHITVQSNVPVDGP